MVSVYPYTQYNFLGLVINLQILKAINQLGLKYDKVLAEYASASVGVESASRPAWREASKRPI